MRIQGKVLTRIGEGGKKVRIDEGEIGKENRGTPRQGQDEKRMKEGNNINIVQEIDTGKKDGKGGNKNNEITPQNFTIQGSKQGRKAAQLVRKGKTVRKMTNPDQRLER